MWFALRLFLGASRSFVVELVALDKAVHASFGVDNLLLTGIERMAVAANFNADLLFGRAKLDFAAAHARRSNVVILGVNSFFHG